MTPADIFKRLGSSLPLSASKGLTITSPCDGEIIARIGADSKKTLGQKITAARKAQSSWHAAREQRVQFLEALAAAIRQHREALAQLITLEAGKTQKEALGEADGSADVILKTIKDASLAEFGGMLRSKERPPIGTVGLITSFNFPLIVANWTLAPALLAGNAVLWKPSEKTPLVALAYKIIFDKVAGPQSGLLQVIIGERDIGAALVAHEGVDMVSATGSVAMGQGIKKTLAKKKNKSVRPILELGGNNGAIISDKMSDAHLEWSVTSLLNSFLGTGGQRCTNTRRLIVHKTLYDKAAGLLKSKLEGFIRSGAIVGPQGGVSNEYGYGPLIDEDAFALFEKAKKGVQQAGGKIIFGKRLLEKEYPRAYYVEPALALMPSQAKIMHEEVFAPLLFVVPYEGDIGKAIALLNAPANAGLTNAIYTQSQQEADRFAAHNQAGHGTINSPKGTGTPAFGMGFGGNKDSGEGEILNAADPLRPFTRDDRFTRVAQNKDIVMDRN